MGTVERRPVGGPNGAIDPRPVVERTGDHQDHQAHDQVFQSLEQRRRLELLERERPDLVVSTHFLPAEMASWMKAKGRLACPSAIVVTDLDVHAMWLCRHFEHYFVALDETKVHLSKLGIPAEKITVTGIPIDPLFAQTKDKAAMRRKHGLETDRTTILVSAGGFGVGPIENLVQSLLELRHRAQVVAICGKSKELKARPEKIATKADAQGNVPGPQGKLPDAQRNVLDATTIASAASPRRRRAAHKAR